MDDMMFSIALLVLAPSLLAIFLCLGYEVTQGIGKARK